MLTEIAPNSLLIQRRLLICLAGMKGTEQKNISQNTHFFKYDTKTTSTQTHERFRYPFC